VHGWRGRQPGEVESSVSAKTACPELPALRSAASCRPSKHGWLIGTTIGTTPGCTRRHLLMRPQHAGKGFAGGGSIPATRNTAAGRMLSSRTPPVPRMPRFLLGALLGPAHRCWGVVPVLPVVASSQLAWKRWQLLFKKPPTGNLGTRTAIRTTVRPQLAHGRDSQSRPNLSYRRLEVLAKFRPLAAGCCARQRATVEPCTALSCMAWLRLRGRMWRWHCHAARGANI
jgi:hypothetical protein